MPLKKKNNVWEKRKKQPACITNALDGMAFLFVQRYSSYGKYKAQTQTMKSLIIVISFFFSFWQWSCFFETGSSNEDDDDAKSGKTIIRFSAGVTVKGGHVHF